MIRSCSLAALCALLTLAPPAPASAQEPVVGAADVEALFTSPDPELEHWDGAVKGR